MNESNATYESRIVVFRTNACWTAACLVIFAFDAFWPDVAGTWFWDFFHWLHGLILTHIR